MDALLDNKVREDLEYNFLYLKDSVAFDIFISSLGIEQHGFNLKFRQAVCNKISSSLDSFYKERTDKDYIKNALKKLIYDDINRLEILLLVNTYIYGNLSNCFANDLENYFFMAYPNMKITKDQKLIRKNLTSRDYRFRNKLINKVINFYNINDKLETKIDKFFESEIKDKILDLNNHMAKQLKIEFQEGKYFILQKENFLTKKDLKSLYIYVQKVFFENLLKTTRRFIWYGLNDKVLSRYKK